MALPLLGINTGVVRHGKQFQALALLIKHPKDEESLVFIPALSLRDLYLCFEHRLYLQNQHHAKEKAAFTQKQTAATQALLKSIPPLTQTRLAEADFRQRVEKLEPKRAGTDALIITFTLRGGNTLEVLIEDAQISLLISAISHAINNAGMHQLSLRLSSLLDFLPMHDADIKESGELEYDSYHHPAWKLSLFSHSLALVYHYTDDDGQQRCCGTVVKSRGRGEMKNTRAIAQRLLAFSPRLRKLENKVCRISVATLATCAGYLPKEQCLKALHSLRDVKAW
jgi:hypothetical protein